MLITSQTKFLTHQVYFDLFPKVLLLKTTSIGHLQKLEEHRYLN